MNPRKIYVASSWSNYIQAGVVQILIAAGHEVYDFKNPPHGKGGFNWNQIDPNFHLWSAKDYRDALKSKQAKSGFSSDIEAMKWADFFVGVQPFGISASLELGWAVGEGKETALIIEEKPRPDLMFKLMDHLCVDIDELLKIVGTKHDDKA